MQVSLENRPFRLVLGISVVALLLAAGLYAYLGTFSRYGGDDYCEAARVLSSTPVGAVFERYFSESWPRATMRYSNLLFVGLSESLGRYNMQITIPAMVLLWFVGGVWLVHEIRKFINMDWDLLYDLSLGLAFGFFGLRQAPNLFETVYWRSAMMTHFAPLVFSLFLLSFVLRQARNAASRPPSPLLFTFLLGATFVIAGFSEPPTTTLLTAVPLLMIAARFGAAPSMRGRYLALLLPVLAGALLGLLAMLLSPATTGAAEQKTFNLAQILGNSFLYSYLFILDTLKSQPLPMLLSMLLSFLLLWLYRQIRPAELSYEQKRLAGAAMAAIPFLAWLLIAAGFAPSVYGQSFPVERMRFMARAILIAAFMLEGALLGHLLGRLQVRPNPRLGQYGALVLFALAAIGYPVRTAVNIVRSDIPQYRVRAEQWDARDAYIRAMKNEGMRDLRVPFLSGEIIQDLGDRTGFRLNRCASVLYGVDSILALPMKGE